MEEYVNNAPVGQEYDEAEIDWTGIFTKLLRHWKQIILIGFIFGCIGIGHALLTKHRYQVTMTLAPELQSRGSGNLNSLASLMGMGPISISGSTDAMSITLFPEICKSTPFLAALLDVPLDSYVSEKDRDAGVQPMRTTVYKHLSGEDKPKYKPKEDEKPYTPVTDPTELTRKQAAGVNALSHAISANVDNKTGITTLTVVMDDPLMAKELADTVCRRLQEYVSNYRTKKAQADYDYYVMLADEAHADLVKKQAAYAAVVDNDRSVVMQRAMSERERLQAEVSLANQIYSQMVQQRELALAKIQEEKPMYAVVQPAVLPQHAANSRSKLVLIWGFIGGLMALAWYGFLDDIVKKTNAEVKTKLKEEKEN